MISIGTTISNGISSLEVQTTDISGNVLPTIIIGTDAPELSWKSYDYADAFLSSLSSPTVTDEDDIYQLTEDLASIGTLTKFIWLAPYVGGTQADHSLNLRYPYSKGGNKSQFFGSPTHNSDGVQGGSSKYAKNGLCLMEIDETNFSMGLYSLDSALTSSIVLEMGFGNGYGDFTGLYLGNNGSMGGQAFFCNKSYGTKLTFSLSNASGQFDCVMNGSRKAIARNGSILATSGSNLGFPNIIHDNFTFLAYAGESAGSARRIALHYIGEHFSDTEIADNYSAFQTFQTSRGREV
jgi:hypothetical protein